MLALRERQVKNLLAITVLSLGTPMLRMGDEMRRSQHGNNNAWCQDNEANWLDWQLLESHAGIHRFVRGLLRLRGLRDSVREDRHLTLAQRRHAVGWLADVFRAQCLVAAAGLRIAARPGRRRPVAARA